MSAEFDHISKLTDGGTVHVFDSVTTPGAVALAVSDPHEHAIVRLSCEEALKLARDLCDAVDALVNS